jgi:hypothetical protein
MKTIKYFVCFILLTFSSDILSQDQSILIFDPNGVSTSFQYTLSQLTEDSVFVVDTLDDAVFNYDGLFLFINPPFALSQEVGNRLIQYTSGNKPVYLFTDIILEGLDTIAFWNHIGIDEMSGLLLSVPIDTVFGVPGEFTEGVVIDTSFMSGLIPVIVGNVDSILIGDAEFWEVNTTYISGYDSLKVIIDLYNLIDDEGFLRRVLEYFELQPPNYVDEEIISLTEFVLSQNYPNPFNPSTVISYRLPVTSNVTLKVYDVLGNEIATLVNEEKQPGTYEVEFSPESSIKYPASGIYFYQLRAGDFIETKKMVLMK